MNFYAHGGPKPRPDDGTSVYVQWFDAESGDEVWESSVPLDRFPRDAQLAPGLRLKLYRSEYSLVRWEPTDPALWLSDRRLFFFVRFVIPESDFQVVVDRGGVARFRVLKEWAVVEPEDAAGEAVRDATVIVAPGVGRLTVRSSVRPAEPGESDGRAMTSGEEHVPLVPDEPSRRVRRWEVTEVSGGRAVELSFEFDYVRGWRHPRALNALEQEIPVAEVV